jgi:hypothetical protein
MPWAVLRAMGEAAREVEAQAEEKKQLARALSLKAIEFLWVDEEGLSVPALAQEGHPHQWRFEMQTHQAVASLVVY